MSEESPATISAIVQAEIQAVSDQERREALGGYLIPPLLHYRDWDYSPDPNRMPCWLVAADTQKGIGIVYSSRGFFPSDHWGVVSMKNDSIGRDDSWFTTIEDAFIQSGLWDGTTPSGYEVS